MSELLFVFALFFVFAVCAVTLLLVSANSYERTVRLTEENYDTRTALAYLSQKIRQNDENGAVRAADLDGCPALVFHQSADGTGYTTYIYLMDGQLKELTVVDGSSVSSESGQTILSDVSLRISETDSRAICFTLTDDDGQTYELLAAPKSVEGRD